MVKYWYIKMDGFPSKREKGSIVASTVLIPLVSGSISLTVANTFHVRFVVHLIRCSSPDWGMLYPSSLA